MNRTLRSLIILIQAMAVLILLSVRLKADTGTCGGATTTVPFTDVGSSIFFCQIAEAFFSGLTNGTSASTYSPSNPVTRDQMAAFITRTQDSALRRGSRRAALNQWWLAVPGSLQFDVGSPGLRLAACDGADIWVPSPADNNVHRFRASDMTSLGTWTNATGANGVLPLKGAVYVTGFTNPGTLYSIDPTAPSPASLIANTLGAHPAGIAFDGRKVWTANNSGSVSIFDTVDLTVPVQTVSLGFSALGGILFDGSNIWVADFVANSLLKLDSSGGILQTVSVGAQPFFPIFDGTNIWVPNHGGNSVTVVRASNGAVLATLTGNGLSSPTSAAFDGQRILITNQGNNSVSLWKAADLTPLTPLGNLSTNFRAFLVTPFGSCSDGTNFFVTADLGSGVILVF